MKTLIFFRHAKSDWDADFDSDHERPLAGRGKKAADAMGRMLAGIGQVPDAVYTSTAVRAHDTLRRAMKAGAWEVRSVVATEALYETHEQGVLAQVRKLSDEYESVMLVGHEPTWSSTVGRLVGNAEVRFPTAAMARIDFDLDYWRDVAFGQGVIIWLLPPRLIS
jgi:phosphohistidine phosphatase